MIKKLWKITWLPIITGVMGVDESYLSATFNAINAQYGSVDNYLEKVMGLSKEKRKILQQKFLE
jgi:protein-tyrosine phosphatase